MKVIESIGINLEVWKDKNFEDFKTLCQGHMTPKDTETKWKELQKLFPPKKKKVVKPKEEGAE